MNRAIIQEILPQVEQPSRYLGNEINTVRKDISRMDLTVALAFPDLYEIGTSHFGIQILYTLLNQKKNVAAERFFTPAPDMEALLREKQAPLVSLESKIDLAAFDVIGFSLLYELNFTNILTMLDLSCIPFLAADRDDGFPLIIGGGPCAFNPEPVADFFDAIVVGDGELAVIDISEAVIDWKKNGDGRKQSLLASLSEIQGVYIPSFFRPSYTDAGIQTLEPLLDGYTRIRRAVLPDLEAAPFPTSPVVPHGKPVHDRLRLEVARGCTRGCRFCQAGMIYRPLRERSEDSLLAIARQALANTGYSDLSLLSLSTGDYSCLASLMAGLLSINPGHCTAISLPSVRAGRLTPQLMSIIRSVRKTGFTIAPEAGTQRLRDVINKNITDDDITDTVTHAFNLGWRVIKLYFMNGLPTETKDDIEAICTLARRLASIRTGGKARASINVSFAPFIPKPHTPFERMAQISIDQARANLTFLKENLRHPGINLKWHDPEMSFLEGVWARGDRRLSKTLIRAWEKGCRLDGWADHFRFDLWMDAFEETGIDPEFFTVRQRSWDETQPWDHIDSGISPKFLKAEWQRATNGETTGDCREGECTGCGLCDFKTVRPVLGRPGEKPAGTSQAPPRPDDNAFAGFRVFYSRLGDARFFGHLELAKIIRRAVRRTSLTVKYSRGFHPAMKLSFDNPLPVGIESEDEFFTLYTLRTADPSVVAAELNQALQGIVTVNGCCRVSDLKTKKAPETASYTVRLGRPLIDEASVQDFLATDQFWVQQERGKGKVRSLDLKRFVRSLEYLDSTTVKMILGSDSGKTIRPAEVLTSVLAVPEEAVKTATILKHRQGPLPC